MKYDFDKIDKVKVCVRKENGWVRVSNNRGITFSSDKLTPSSMMLALLHQTLNSQFEMWDAISAEFSIE
ncbi:MAG: hypothetical protein II275_05520, partial [Bacteroidaceae bacterium]|nr:hypothetical protein [Bacteroidaceae bacterium]